jgi:hypothetical protein
MNYTLRLAIALGLVILLGVGGVLVLNNRPSAPEVVAAPTSAAVTQATLNCYGGSEKTDLMADADIKRILQERYSLAVNFQPRGSIDQVLLSTDQLKQAKIDCLMPSSAAAQLVFEAKHNTATDFPAYQASGVLLSPEVIYSGPQATDALVAAGLVQQREGRYYVLDQKKLMLDYSLKNATWDGLKTPNIRGPIYIRTTDPARSNSGFTEYLLLLTIAATNDPYQAPSPAQARPALPTIRTLYEAQGLQARSSGFGFDEWILQGGELSAPLYAGYENQILDKVARFPDQVKSLLGQVRMLYPEPTAYNDHLVLALDPDAARLIDALKDPEIQEIAWKRYGFRSVLLGTTNVSDFPDVALSDKLQVSPLPNADVILMLNDCLVNKACTP